MAKFKKKVLEPGTYQSPDGEIIITPERINHWVNSFKEMKNAGLKIPTPWGHQSKASPDYEEREFTESKYNAGFIDSFATDSNGALIAVLDVPREEDIDRVGTVVQEVSPQVETSWRDGKGKVWTDVITHLALVTHPVVPNQDNFEIIAPVGATRLSLKQKLSNSTSGEKPMADEVDTDTDTDTVAEEVKKPEESKKSDKPKKKKEKEVPNFEENEEGTEGAGGLDPELLDLLASCKIIIPDDITEKDFIPALKAACATLKHSQEGGMGGGEGADDLLQGLDLGGLEDAMGGEKPPETPTEPPAEGGAETPEKGPLMEQQPSMTMSLNQKNTEDRLVMLQNKLEEADRNRMANEIELLLSQGKITPVIASNLKNDLKGYRLSLNSNGVQDVSLAQSKIEAFKLMPEGSAWGNEERIRLRAVAEEALPSEFKNFSNEEAEKIADNQLKATGKSTTYQF